MLKQSMYIIAALVAVVGLGCDSKGLVRDAHARVGLSKLLPADSGFSHWIYDHGSYLYDADPTESSAYRTTVQLVNVTGDPPELKDGTYRFKYTTMEDIRMHWGHTQPLCPSVWDNQFRTQPMLGGRSGTLLADGTVLTSDHGGAALSSMYIIIARTNAFEVDEQARVVVVPESHVRQPSCILERVNDPNNHVDWMRLKLAGAQTAPWAKGLELAESVARNQRLAASFHPLGLPAKFSKLTPVDVRDSVYSLDIDSADGCSGGGLIDENGQLAGVVTGALLRRTWLEKMKFKHSSCIEARPYQAEQFTPVQSIIFTKEECTDTRTKENQDHADTSHHRL